MPGGAGRILQLTREEQARCDRDGKVMRWVNVGGHVSTAQADAYVSAMKELGYSPSPNGRRVGNLAQFEIPRAAWDERQKAKATYNEERMKRHREAGALELEREALRSKGVRPVGKDSLTDVDFDKTIHYRGDKVEVPRREEE